MTVINNAAIQLITIATSILIARYLGPDGRGNLAIIMFYPQLCMTLSLIGFDRGISVAAKNNARYKYSISIPTFSLLFSTIAIIAALSFINYLSDDVSIKNLSLLYLLYIPPVTLFLLASSYFNGIGDFRNYNFIRLTFYMSNLIITSLILVLDYKNNLTLAVYANLISGYIVGLLSAILLIKSDNKIIGKIKLLPESLIATFVPRRRCSDAHTPRAMIYDIWVGKSISLHLKSFVECFISIFSLSWKFVPLLSLGYISSSMPQLLAVSNLDSTLIGLFVINLTYSRLGSSISSAVGAHLFYNGMSGMDFGFHEKFRGLAILYLCISVFLMAFSKIVISSAFGDNFFYGFNLIAVLVAASCISQISEMVSEYFRGRQILRPDNYSLMLYVLIMVLFGYVLTSKLQIIGLGISVLIAEIFRLILLIFFGHKLCEIRVDRLMSFQIGDLKKIIESAVISLRKFLAKN